MAQEVVRKHLEQLAQTLAETLGAFPYGQLTCGQPALSWRVRFLVPDLARRCAHAPPRQSSPVGRVYALMFSRTKFLTLLETEPKIALAIKVTPTSRRAR